MIALFASWSFQELTSQYLDLFKSEMSSLINKRLVVYHNRNFESMSEMGELIGVWLCVEKGGGWRMNDSSKAADGRSTKNSCPHLLYSERLRHLWVVSEVHG